MTTAPATWSAVGVSPSHTQAVTRATTGTPLEATAVRAVPMVRTLRYQMR
jgi:hypothetical protein